MSHHCDLHCDLHCICLFEASFDVSDLKGWSVCRMLGFLNRKPHHWNFQVACVTRLKADQTFLSLKSTGFFDAAMKLDFLSQQIMLVYITSKAMISSRQALSGVIISCRHPFASRLACWKCSDSVETTASLGPDPADIPCFQTLANGKHATKHTAARDHS